MKSPDVTTAALDIEVQAASVDTGSGMKNGKLKSKDFFDVDKQSNDHVQVDQGVADWSDHIRPAGHFTIRGVSKPETLHLMVSGKGQDRHDQGEHGLRP